MTMTMDEADKQVKRKYSTAISKGAGMIEETRRLLEQWRPDEALDDFTRRVQTEGLLGNATAYRTRDVVRRVFAPRFLRPSDKPARILQEEIAARLRSGQGAVGSGQNEEPAEITRRYRDLFIARRTLPGLIDELKAEINRRRPAEDSGQRVMGGGQAGVGEVREPEAEAVVEADVLLEPALIATAADLDAWLAGIREKLAGLLKAGKRIKVSGSHKER